MSTKSNVAPVAASSNVFVAGETGKFCFALSRTLRPVGATFDKVRKIWCGTADLKDAIAAAVSTFPGLTVQDDDGSIPVKAEKPAKVESAKPAAKVEAVQASAKKPGKKTKKPGAAKAKATADDKRGMEAIGTFMVGKKQVTVSIPLVHFYGSARQ